MTLPKQHLSIPIRLWCLPIVALVSQMLLIRFHDSGSIPVGYLKTGLILTYLILFIAILFNLRLTGIRLMAVGVVLNFIVIAANGGLMPLSPEAVERVAPAEYASNLVVGQPVPNSKDILIEKDNTVLW